MLTQDQRSEMDKFMRQVSPLVSYVKSLRMEGEGGSSTQNPSQQQTQEKEDAQKIVDHFEGIDLDELPENVRTAITGAKQTIQQTTTAAQTAEQRRVQAEGFARKNQSEADRLRGVLQHHNLGTPTKQNLSGDKMAERVARLEAKGLKPEAAKVYAEMLGEEAALQEKELFEKFAPMAGALGHVQAQQHLATAEVEHANLFSIPEVAKAVRDNVTVMVQQGNSVNEKSIEHLLEMAYGSYAMKNPGKLAPTITEVPRLGGGGGMGSGGGYQSKVDAATDGKPIARQPETPGIIAAINAQMVKDLPAKKK